MPAVATKEVKRSGREDVEIFLLPVLKATIAADLCRQQRQGSICVLALWCVVRDASEPTAVGSNWQFPLKPAGAL